MGLVGKLVRDARAVARSYGEGELTVPSLARTVLFYDGYVVLAMSRVRELARRWHLPGVNRGLRLVQMALYGIEIGKDVQLGEGVVFVHTLGTVIGGDARIGDRVRIMGNVTIGTAKDNGYPRIGNDVSVGAGARILGPVEIGDGAVIGANAVVLVDVPAGALAIGVPATVRRAAAGSNAAGAAPATGPSERTER
ncbi:MAG: serine acetyltransferase [Myxococcales bacterium]|nr:serine acetyltransferase [Myxococcales bacterium]